MIWSYSHSSSSRWLYKSRISDGENCGVLPELILAWFLNMAMLLSESEQARALRQLILDVVIDLINRKTGGGTKYINQRDKDFLFSSLQEDHSLDEGEHQKFLGAAEDELEHLMAENQDVLRRLKERE